MSRSDAQCFQYDCLACETKIIELLKQNHNKPIAIAINGEWGVGKTYFWKNTLAPKIQNEFEKAPIYTSVFGKRDENAIIQDLVTQFLRNQNKMLKVTEGIVNNMMKICGLNVDSSVLFDLLQAEDLKDTIVCIDDFERLSDKIPPQDILGLIAELKENKGCCVVVIYNNDQLFKYEKEKEDSNNQDQKVLMRKRKIFEKYREKIFDYQILFAPSPQQQFEQFNLKLDNGFSSYPFLPDILDIQKLLLHHKSINFRELSKADYTYRLLLEYFDLEEYPSDEFKKTYRYLLYSIIYAYHFDLHKDYFGPIVSRGVSNLLLATTSMHGDLLRLFLSSLEYGLKPIRSSSFFGWSNTSVEKKSKVFFKNFVEKIISDTKFHKDYSQELENANHDKTQASIAFFLKHVNNLEALPYILGFRILDYAFQEDENEINPRAKIKSFDLIPVIEKHKEKFFELFKQWCDDAYAKIHNHDMSDWDEYFWIDSYTFIRPLQNAFKTLEIEMPQHELIKLYI